MAVDLPLTTSIFATPHRFLWHAPTKTAVLADVHLGIESSLSAQGIYLPHVQGPIVRRQWNALLERHPAHIVVAGDLFDRPQPDERAVALCHTLFHQVEETCRVTLIRGNHDPAGEALRDVVGVGEVR